MLKEIVFARFGHGTLLEQYMSRKLLGSHETEIGTNTDPYLFRRSPSLGDYNACHDEIVGASVGFNQLVDTTDTSVTVPSGHKYIAKINGTWSVGTSSGTALTVDGSNNDMVIDLTAMLGSTIADYIVTQGNTNGVAFFRKYFDKDCYAYNAGELKSVSGLVSHDMTGFNQFNLDNKVAQNTSNYNRLVGQTVDTTPNQSAVVSGDNPITVQAGAWKGLTFFSEELVPNMNYKVECTVSSSSNSNLRESLFIVDENNAIVSRPTAASTATTWAETVSVTEAGLRIAFVVETNKTGGDTMVISNLCCHLVWDGSRDGEYEPYVKHSYPLDSTVELRGLFKMDADHNIYAEGDRYEADGTVTRKYASVDLGTLTWQKVDVTSPYFQASYSPAYKYEALQTNFICSKYVHASIGSSGSTEGIFLTDGNYVRIRDLNYTSVDATAFKTAMSGVYLVYELASPTTETATPYAKTQKVDPSGTEEYVSMGVVPVGHNTTYVKR